MSVHPNLFFGRNYNLAPFFIPGYLI